MTETLTGEGRNTYCKLEPLDICKEFFSCFLHISAFFIAALLLFAAAECQQAEVGEAEAGNGSSSLADFVNILIVQINDVKVGMFNISIVDVSTQFYKSYLVISVI